MLWCAAVAIAQADVTENDRRLLHAAGQGWVERVEALLKAGANVNARHPPWQLTPLLVASEVDAATVDLLLERGAAVNVHDRDGLTPLMKAVSTRDLQTISRLLQAGADVDARDHRGHTALTHAVLHSEPAILKRLLAHGARTDVVTAMGTTPWSLAQAMRAAARAMPESPSTVLHVHGNGAPHRMRSRAEALAQTQAVLNTLTAAGVTQPQQPVKHFDAMERHRHH